MEWRNYGKRCRSVKSLHRDSSFLVAIWRSSTPSISARHWPICDGHRRTCQKAETVGPDLVPGRFGFRNRLPALVPVADLHVLSPASRSKTKLDLDPAGRRQCWHGEPRDHEAVSIWAAVDFSCDLGDCGDPWFVALAQPLRFLFIRDCGRAMFGGHRRSAQERRNRFARRAHRRTFCGSPHNVFERVQPFLFRRHSRCERRCMVWGRTCSGRRVEAAIPIPTVGLASGIDLVRDRRCHHHSCGIGGEIERMTRPDPAPKPIQFGLRSLFLVTSAIAIALGVLKWLGPRELLDGRVLYHSICGAGRHYAQRQGRLVYGLGLVPAPLGCLRFPFLCAVHSLIAISIIVGPTFLDLRPKRPPE